MLIKQSLNSLLSPWLECETEALKGIEVSNLELDSRKIVKGDIFVAVAGHATDGRQFISKAIENGATAVIAQAGEEHLHGVVQVSDGVPTVYIDELNLILSELSARLFRSESGLIGVTGTNGKTTITQLIAQWMELCGSRAGVLGTTGNGFLDNLTASENTTGSAIDINRTLALLSQQGADYSALEVSSHGLVQGRIRALPFSVGVFTNLSRDHLDYHGTMEEYAQAKLSLFTQHQCEQSVINADDSVGARWLTQLPEAVAVSINGEPSHPRSLWARSVNYSDKGIEISFDGFWGEGEFSVPLIGAFNASNVLLTLAALLSLGFDKESLLSKSGDLKPVIGRMELFKGEKGARIVVDYAHTPDALEKALSALRVHCKGELWAIFGCGGDRDTGKRPMMAEIAERLADKVILTDDNPRSEDPEVIFRDMFKGMEQPENAMAVHDRYSALKLAAEQADSSDIILMAGKGHEDYQVLKDKTIHYSDRESAIEILRLKA